MDLWLYVSSVQDRLFIALMGLLLSCVVDIGAAALFGNRADPRPLLEQVTDFLVGGISTRLDKAARGQGALVLRGAILLAIACAIYYALGAWILMMTRHLGYSGVFLALFMMASTGILGWFGPLRALSNHLSNPQAPRPYQVLSRATYTNMIGLDDSGLIRNCATAAVQSILFRVAGPVILFALLGWVALILYWPVMVIVLSAGQAGANRGFALIANTLARLFLILPTLVLWPIALLSTFFSAGSSFFRAVPGLFASRKWPPILQGGVTALMVAYAMKLTLGGPRQDRKGQPVPAMWIGPDNATAKLASRDIGRILYWQMVCILLLGVTLYILSIIPTPLDNPIAAYALG
ncbi:MAG TPA: hypothetical protein VIN59_05905 [Alphaproteobacteria bacterium]